MAIYRCEDPVLDWDLYCADQEEEMKKYPKCDKCGEPIVEEYFFEINGYNYCEDCMKDEFMVWTEERISA